MKIATFNVNGINGRLPVLLKWLESARPDVVRLQELEALQEKFPESAVQDDRYSHSGTTSEMPWVGMQGSVSTTFF